MTLSSQPMLLCFALHSPALLHFFTPLQTVVWLGHSPKPNMCLLTALFKVESWETNCPNSGNQIQARHEQVEQALRPVTTHLTTQGLELRTTSCEPAHTLKCIYMSWYQIKRP